MNHMATYKVAQDVEAEDKLLGPFSFRQFIYLIIAAMAGVLAWGLSNVFPLLFIIPLPIVVFFLVLALPLRKDQPMEIYLAAIVSFYVKPRKRLWQPDGIESLIEITVPRDDEKSLTKAIGGEEADRRLEYLATIADTQGWAMRNIAEPIGTSMNSDVYHEAQGYQDVFDASGTVAQSFNSMLDSADAARRQGIINNMQQSTAAPQQVITPANSMFAPTAPQQQAANTTYQQPTYPPANTIPQPVAQPVDATIPEPHFDPYPSNMRQHVISPTAPGEPAAVAASPAPTTPEPTSVSEPRLASTPIAEPAKQPETTSNIAVSPDIISLANNHDLSIETIAREAHRIEAKNKQDDDQEVVISLR